MTAPKKAVWAVRLWFVAAALFGLTAVWAVVVGAVNDSALLIGIGVLSGLVGAALAVLTRRAAPGDARWRSTVAVLTLVGTVFGMVLTVLSGIPFVLISGLVGVIGSMLSYRPDADGWFTEEAGRG